MARRRLAAWSTTVAVPAVLAVLAACGSDATARHPVPPVVDSAPAPGPGVTGADWPTYGHDAARSGAATGVPRPGVLKVAWHARLDGAVYAQPLVIGGRIVVATEGGTVYALRPDGTQIWRRHVAPPVPLSALPCGDIDPLGITGTPVYDQASGLVFAVAETTGGTHLLAGIRLADGTIQVRREIAPPRGDPIATQQRPALALYGHRVYVAFGGLDGDCGQYVGSVVSVAANGSGPVWSFAVPTGREGGIWATGGAVASGGRLLVSVGNGASTTAYDGSDSVMALSPGLRRLDLFAPDGWAADNQADADLGSMTPAVTGGYVFISGKNGTGYVLRAGLLGGIGGQVAKLPFCRGFGTAAVSGDAVYVPCADSGIRQVIIGPGGTPQAGWTAQAAGAHGSPVTGGGAVWTVDVDAGVLYALDAASGAILASVPVGQAPHFAAPSLSGSRAYVGTLDGVVAVSGA